MVHFLAFEFSFPVIESSAFCFKITRQKTAKKWKIFYDKFSDSLLQEWILFCFTSWWKNSSNSDLGVPVIKVEHIAVILIILNFNLLQHKTNVPYMLVLFFYTQATRIHLIFLCIHFFFIAGSAFCFKRSRQKTAKKWKIFYDKFSDFPLQDWLLFCFTSSRIISLGSFCSDLVVLVF
jgi:hypothetical protein